MIYMQPESLGWRPFVDSWLPTCSTEWCSGARRQYISDLIDWVVPPCLIFIRNKCVQVSCPLSLPDNPQIDFEPVLQSWWNQFGPEFHTDDRDVDERRAEQLQQKRGGAQKPQRLDSSLIHPSRGFTSSKLILNLLKLKIVGLGLGSHSGLKLTSVVWWVLQTVVEGSSGTVSISGRVGKARSYHTKRRYSVRLRVQLQNERKLEVLAGNCKVGKGRWMQEHPAGFDTYSWYF